MELFSNRPVQKDHQVWFGVSIWKVTNLYAFPSPPLFNLIDENDQDTMSN